MQDYRVELETFSGPLDLLLFLVRRDEIDLLDIPVGRLTEQYLEHLGQLQHIDVNLAGEFLVMAATLLEIKSAMLLPTGGQAPAEEAATPSEPLDPRMELVQQLLAYKRFKDAALELEARFSDWQLRYARRPASAQPQTAAAPPDRGADADTDAEHFDEEAGAVEFDLEDANVMDLAEAFARIMESIGQGPGLHQVVYDDTPISLYEEDVLDRLGRDGTLTLGRLFEGRNRSERIGLFLAILELVRQRKVRLRAEEFGAEVEVELRPEGDAAAPEPPAADQSRWTDPQTGQVEYEWPDEEARQAAQHRAELRAKWAARKQAEQAAAGAAAVEPGAEGAAGPPRGEPGSAEFDAHVAEPEPDADADPEGPDRDADPDDQPPRP